MHSFGDPWHCSVAAMWVGRLVDVLSLTCLLLCAGLTVATRCFLPNYPRKWRTEHNDPVQAAVADLLPNSHVLIMSFSHAQDLDVVGACLQRLRLRNDLGFVGLIGSATKWATFQRRLAERGFCPQRFCRITCPIGVAGIDGKQPEVIAVAVAAQLLKQSQQSQNNRGKIPINCNSGI
jgi:xanthine/CO dehydrogenase XdhC/CoxF family maturation factor